MFGLSEVRLDFKIYTLFGVPLAQIQRADPGELNATLKQHILRLESEGQRQRNPSPAMAIHPQLFESRFDLFASAEPCVVALKEFCFGHLRQVIGELADVSPADLAALKLSSHTWFHVTRSGGYFALHNHPMASWSGVYCVDPGDGAGGDNGAISFFNPIGAANMFVDRGNARLRLPFANKNFILRQEAGELVIFPSYLFHQVLPYLGTRERITVAFNCWFPG